MPFVPFFPFISGQAYLSPRSPCIHVNMNKRNNVLWAVIGLVIAIVAIVIVAAASFAPTTNFYFDGHHIRMGSGWGVMDGPHALFPSHIVLYLCTADLRVPSKHVATLIPVDWSM